MLTPARLIQQRTAIINPRWEKSRFFKMYHLFQEMSVCPLQPSSQASAGNKPKSLFHFLKAKKKTCWCRNRLMRGWSRWPSPCDWSSTAMASHVYKYMRTVEAYVPRNYRLESKLAGVMMEKSGLLTAVFTWVVSTKWWPDPIYPSNLGVPVGCTDKFKWMKVPNSPAGLPECWHAAA